MYVPGSDSRVGHSSRMDYVTHGEIQGRYLVFFKAHGPVFYHVWNSPL